MDLGTERTPPLPSGDEIRRAVCLYLKHAYGAGDVPPAAQRLIPPASFRPEDWLMSDLIERDPASAPLPVVRSFALRLGNAGYPNMKLRISRPPKDPVFVLSVDCHDAILRAPQGSADQEAMESLKRNNAAIASAIHAAWEADGLTTERGYLRRKIEQAKARDRGR